MLDIDGPHKIGTSTKEEVDLANSLGKKNPLVERRGRIDTRPARQSAVKKHVVLLRT